MKLNARFAGTPLRDHHTAVEWRHTMNYAAAVGDPNPVYFDDERESGIIAPPMFAVALTWQISGQLSRYIESSDFSEAILQTQVHYTEHLQLHRPLRPGDKLTISGRIAAILPHRLGTCAVIRYDARDEHQTPVFTEHIGGLMRGVSCVDGPAGQDAVPHVPRHEQPWNAPEWSGQIRIDPLLPYIYDGCTDIVFPIHTSKKFARSVGLPGIIVQGTATLALAVREITDRFANGDPAGIKAIACRFTDMVLPGTHITVETRTADSDENRIQFRVKNENGGNAISHGTVALA